MRLVHAVPCRHHASQEGMEKILGNRATLADIATLESLAATVSRTSRCGLGQTAPNPILTTMRNFPQAYEARLQSEAFLPRRDTSRGTGRGRRDSGTRTCERRGSGMSEDKFTFTVDGVEVEATPGQTIIQACDAAGIYIPRLCYHPDLEPAGHCRVCTCKINGRTRQSCTMPAAHGMVVESNTPN